MARRSHHTTRAPRGRAEAVAGALERTGLSRALTRLPTWRGVLVLTYHRIGGPDGGVHDPGVWSATQDRFDEQVRTLARNSDVVSGAELGQALGARRGRRVALTFDDGYRDNHELAYPVLRAHGLPATFFVATGFLDDPRVAWWDEISWMVRTSTRSGIDAGPFLPGPVRWDAGGRDDAARRLVERYWHLPQEQTGGYLAWLADACGTGRAAPSAAASTWMTWEMVHEMRAGGMAFGAHTVSHPVLARCSAERQAREIGGSVARLGEVIGERVALFAHPVGFRGSFDDTTRACLSEEGVTHAFSFSGGYHRARASDAFDVPRVAVGPSLSMARFRGLLALPQLFARRPRGRARP